MSLRTQKYKSTKRLTNINVPLKVTVLFKLKLLNRQKHLQYSDINQHFLSIIFKQDIEANEKQLNQLKVRYFWFVFGLGVHKPE